ncbi:unnamed protein product [Strongylus vulgaris]|uniref:Uncharacterized protein n=1 Tax=Strongylus vulgaris TaxID=40348 RepID=A0A3P7JEU1_STRVU|nr:unnamed protein product [Strongylus vulgaris]
MRCDLYAVTLSIMAGVTASPISDLIERTIVDENSILSIPSPAGAHEMLDIVERRTSFSKGGDDKGENGFHLFLFEHMVYFIVAFMIRRFGRRNGSREITQHAVL